MRSLIAIGGLVGTFALGWHCSNLLDEADRTYARRYPLDPRSPSPASLPPPLDQPEPSRADDWHVRCPTAGARRSEAYRDRVLTRGGLCTAVRHGLR